MLIAVAGGTGAAGRKIVGAVVAAGHEAVVLARSTGVDITTGVGLDDALPGVSVLIDASNRTTVRRRASVAFFATSTQHLLDAEKRGGVAHHVVLSIVGIDRVDLGYYEGKRKQEELVLNGDVPATVLRATQFHGFPEQLLDQSPGPVAIIPRMLSQTVDTRDVAAELVRVALEPPRGRAPDLAGPETHEMPELARRLIRAQGMRRRVVPVTFPGAAGRAMRDGSLIPTTPGPRGAVTFEDWLRQR